MALFTEQNVQAGIRVRDGRRVFYLGADDRLTPAAQSWLRQEKIAVLPAAEAKPEEYRTLCGAVLREKPEHMTHLTAEVLVNKDHPRIIFRGEIDALEAELLLAQYCARQEQQPELERALEESLAQVRQLIACDVLGEQVSAVRLGGLDEAQLRLHSHQPQKYYQQPHFLPAVSDGLLILTLNRLRTAVRRTELAAYRAFQDENGLCTREDIVRFLNRLSSFIWILMIRCKAQSEGREKTPWTFHN